MFVKLWDIWWCILHPRTKTYKCPSTLVTTELISGIQPRSLWDEGPWFAEMVTEFWDSRTTNYTVLFLTLESIFSSIIFQILNHNSCTCSISAAHKLSGWGGKYKNMLHCSLSGGQIAAVRSSGVTENLRARCCDSLQCSFNLADKASCRKLCQICPACHCFSSKPSKWRITLFHWTIPNRHKHGQTEQQRV